MLEVSTGIVCRIIDRAKEFHAQEGVVFPETSGGSEIDSDQAMQVLAAHAEDLTFQELRAALESAHEGITVELESRLQAINEELSRTRGDLGPRGDRRPPGLGRLREPSRSGRVRRR